MRLQKIMHFVLAISIILALNNNYDMLLEYVPIKSTDFRLEVGENHIMEKATTCKESDDEKNYVTVIIIITLRAYLR